MHLPARPHRTSLLLVVAAIALSAAPAHAADAGCTRLVTTLNQRYAGSGIGKLNEQVQAHRVTAALIDALGKKLQLEKGWIEGNSHWEEAYALFRPDLQAGIHAAGERELRRLEEKLPPALDPSGCKKHLALLESKAGAAADRLEYAKEGRGFVASLEKTGGIPPRLAAQVEAVRRELAEAAATPEDPAVAIARGTLQIHGKRYAAAQKGIGGPDPAVEKRATSEAAAAMMTKNRATLDDIVRRFRAEGAGPKAGRAGK